MAPPHAGLSPQIILAKKERNPRSLRKFLQLLQALEYTLSSGVKWIEMESVGEQISNLAEPPNSTAQAKIDDKGRLKLPSESLDWCKKSSVVNVFVTTVDKKTVRIYPIPLWKSTLKMLEAPGEHAKAGADLARIAKYYGGDAEIDTQGRLLVPATLRTLMGLESEPVCLEHVKGRIDVTKKTVHDALLQAAESNLDEKVETFGKLGL